MSQETKGQPNNGSIYKDPVYGKVLVEEPVLLNIIGSDALQRLQGVLQHGISGMLGVTSPITRFEHSLGVMFLVRRLGGSIEEQIAALLHDVSHTAFSHVIDYVFDGHVHQSYHDDKKEEYVAGTDLPELLQRHGFHWRDFLQEENFLLLEQPAPRLCADRLDYFLRDSIPLGLATDSEIQSALEHLVVEDGRIVTDSLHSARWLGYTYIEADERSWANFREVGLYELTAQAIKRALDIGILSEQDFWRTDDIAWSKMHVGDDPELQAALKMISIETRFEWDDQAPTFRVSTKVRSIDPDVLVDGRLFPLSALDPDFAAYRGDYHARKQGKWPMRVIPSTTAK